MASKLASHFSSTNRAELNAFEFANCSNLIKTSPPSVPPSRAELNASSEFANYSNLYLIKKWYLAIWWNFFYWAIYQPNSVVFCTHASNLTELIYIYPFGVKFVQTSCIISHRSTSSTYFVLLVNYVNTIVLVGPTTPYSPGVNIYWNK